MLEMVFFKNRRGWVQHAGGVGKLLEMRGAAAHQEKAART